MTSPFFNALASHFKAPEQLWDTPFDAARHFDPKTVQTPALTAIDEFLMRAYSTPDFRGIISMPPQNGKALALDTPVPTPTGWSTMGKLKVGDKVFGRNGKPCTVTWKSQVWEGHDCYEVTTGDGESIIANAAHEWAAKLDRRRSEKIIDTTVLAKPRSKQAQITAGAVLELPEASLPVDPYVLGAWLGDGSSRNAHITTHPDDYQILKRIGDAGYPARKLSSKYLWSLAEPGSKASTLRKGLVDAGVFMNKHVPQQYLRASAEQRLALLQGLVDTDGHVSPRGQVEFCATNKRLAEAVVEIVYSLGAKAVMSESPATLNGKVCGTKYRVHFYLKDAAYLERKAVRCKDSSVSAVRYVSAKQVESVPTVCIEVDSPDHMYLAGRTMLPTHNSMRASIAFPAWVLQQNPDTRIVIASYESQIAIRFSDALRRQIKDRGQDAGLVIGGKDTERNWGIRGHRGGVYAASVGGALTSRSADLLIIDDPVKGFAEAASPTYQAKTWDWWTGTALTRVQGGGSVIVILTRWHDDDLAGQLMRANPGVWDFLRIPAQADHRPELGESDPLGREPGEYMQSVQGFTREQWEERKKQVGPKTWAALYQGVPSPDEGGIFPATWARYEQPLWEVQPNGARHVPGVGRPDHELVQSWDFTFSDTKGSDYVVGQVWLRVGSQAYLLDMVRERMNFPTMLDAVRNLTAKWPQAQTTFIEAKAAGQMVIDTLRTELKNAFIPINPTESKVARANAVSPFAFSGNIVLPTAELLPSVGEMLEELKLFPASSHDDSVDALTQAVGQLLLYRIDNLDTDPVELFDDFSITYEY